MNNSWTERWDDRYSNEEFAYGEEPNNYFKEQIEKLNPETILFPAEGEGRNAEIIELQEKEIELNEGVFHNGKGSVIRFIGRKK